MELLSMILVVAVVGILVFAVKRIRDERTTDSTTSAAQGTIRGGFHVYNDGEYYYYWRIEYTVDGIGYELHQESYSKEVKEMDEHRGEAVTVHYDPNRPRVAWAETPDSHAYTNSKAKEVDKVKW